MTIEDFRGRAAADLQLVGRRARRAVDASPTPAATASRCSTRCTTRARPTPSGSSTQNELKDRIADAIARLPEREKLVIALYYYENLTLREIGEVLGVTESRVSQLHTKAVLRLRSRLHGRRTPSSTRALADPDARACRAASRQV